MIHSYKIPEIKTYLSWYKVDQQLHKDEEGMREGEKKGLTEAMGNFWWFLILAVLMDSWVYMYIKIHQNLYLVHM